MLKWIINYFVGKFLTDYLEIDTNKTQSGLLSGKFVLENIKIRKDVFRKLKLPFFEIKNSFIGKISIELTKIATFHPEEHPINIIIEDVFVNISQKGINDWTEEKKLEELKASKKALLAKMEELYASFLQNQNIDEEVKTSKFVIKLVNNLNLMINHVIIRFEDDISYPSNPYCMAFLLKNIKTLPNKDLKSQFKIHDNQQEILMINKKLVMDDFSVYMDIMEDNRDNDFVNYIVPVGREKANQLRDYLKKEKNITNSSNNQNDDFEFYAYCHSEIIKHMNEEQSHNYLLYNLDFTLDLVFNLDYKINHKSFIDVDLLINQFYLKANLHQIKVLMKVFYFITVTQAAFFYEIEQKFFPKKDMSEDFIKKYLEFYINYFEAKHFKKNNSIEYEHFASQLEQMEEGYTYLLLQKVRYIAYEKLKYLGKLDYINDKISEKTPGVIGGFFTSQETLVELKKLEKARELHTETQSIVNKKQNDLIRNFNKNKDLIEKEIKEKQDLELKEEKASLPDNYIKIKFKLRIQTLTIKLLTNIICKNPDKTVFDYYKSKNANAEPQDENFISNILEIKLTDFELLLLMGLIKMQVFTFLDNIEILQFLSHHTKFNKILETYLDKPVGIISNIKNSQIEQINSESLYIKDSFNNQANLYPREGTNNRTAINEVNRPNEEKGGNFIKKLKKNLSTNINSRKNSSLYSLEDNSTVKQEREYDMKKGALFISFEMNPELPNSSLKLRVRNAKRLYIYLNIYSLKLLGFLFSEVLKSEIDLETISKTASAEVYKNIIKGYNKMKSQVVVGDNKPFCIHADISFKSPKIIIPQNILNKKNKNCLLINIGDFTMHSHLANRIADSKHINVRTLKYYDNLFDNYDLTIEGFEILQVYDFKDLKILNNDLELFSQGNSEVRNFNRLIPIVDKVDLNIILSQLIEPQNVYNEKFKVAVHINEFSVNLNEQIVEFLSFWLYNYAYFNYFYEIEINKITKDPFFMRLTDKKIYKEIPQSKKIDLKLDRNFNNKKIVPSSFDNELNSRENSENGQQTFHSVSNNEREVRGFINNDVKDNFDLKSADESKDIKFKEENNSFKQSKFINLINYLNIFDAAFHFN